VLVRFIPESVLAGFTVGAGVLIGLMQLDEALGLPPVAGAGTFAEYAGIARHLAAGLRPAPAAVLTTVLCIAVISSGRYVRKRLPLALFVVLGAAGAARALGLSAEQGLPLVSDRLAVPAGWPPGAWPDLDPAVVTTLLLPAAAIVLLGTLELLVVTRADPSRPDVKAEIVAQGAANAVGAFASAFPASASLTRSALLRYGHPASRLAAAIAALVTLPMLVFGSALINYIPQAALAAVLLVTAWSMVAQPSLVRLWRASGVSRVLLLVTAVSTLILPLEWAVFVGAGLGLVIHLARTSRPRVRALTFHDARLVPVAHGEDPVAVVLEISGTVHYAAAESLLEQLAEHLPRSARTVIVDLSHAHELRFTGLRALEWWADDLRRRGVQLRLAGVTDEVRDLIESTGSQLAYTAWDAEPGRSVWRTYEDMQNAK
jgi:SulP family sulfate permease